MRKQRAARPPETKAVRLDLPKELHKRLRILAAQSGGTMSQYARAVVEKAIRDELVIELQPLPEKPKVKRRRPPKG